MKQLLFFCTLLSYVPAFAQETVYRDFEADSAAQPRGGMVYLNGFLQANLRKPVQLESQGVGGRAVVTGIVEPDGHITDVKAIPGKFPELDREAVRVFGLFNAWQPAQKGGKAVRQQVNIPVMFKPNAPFLYVDGAVVRYFDAARKPVAEASDGVSYKQVSPVDSIGLPTGDIVVYKRKGKTWEEDYRLPFFRSKPTQRSAGSKSVYFVGNRNEDKQWQGTVVGIGDTGALVSQIEYTNGRSTGTELFYHANGLVAERSAEVDGKKNATSWYENGQIRQIGSSDKAIVMTATDPDRVSALWNSAGQQLVREGNGRGFYTTMRQSRSDTTRQTQYIEQGLFAGGFKQGIWTGRYADGSYFYEEEYDRGICKGGKSRAVGSDTVRYQTQQEQPEFKGGLPGLGQFLTQNLRYPVDAQREGIQGKVYISFVVCTDGTLCDYEVLKGVTPSIDNEALRVVKAMSGRWKPGAQRGQKVRVKYNLPINFNLQ